MKALDYRNPASDFCGLQSIVPLPCVGKTKPVAFPGSSAFWSPSMPSRKLSSSSCVDGGGAAEPARYLSVDATTLQQIPCEGKQLQGLYPLTSKSEGVTIEWRP